MSKVNLFGLGLLVTFSSASLCAADDLHTIDQKITTPQYNNSGSGYYNQGGYRTNTQVIGSRFYYVLRAFSARDFDAYMPLAHRAMAFDQFEKWVAAGKVSWQGVIQGESLKVGNTVFPAAQLVSIDRLQEAFRQLYPADKLFQDLIDKGVLDSRGTIIGLGNTNDPNMNESSFAFIKTKLQSAIHFEIQHTVLQDQLVQELYELMVTHSKVIEVTQEDTTRYQSRSGNILNDVFNTAVGNTVGAVVFPDRVKVQKSEVAWNPNIRVDSFYPKFTTGFLPYPYYYGSEGILGLNGYPNQTYIGLQSLGDSGINYLGLDFGRYYLFPQSGVDTAGYGKVSVGYWQMEQTGNVIRFGDVSVGIGVASTHFIGGFDLGLVYRSGLSTSSLGIKIGGDAAWYPIAPLFLFGSFHSYSQPNLLKNETVWSANDLSLGIGVQVMPVAVRTGFKTLSDVQGNTLFSGWFVGAQYQFN